MLCVRERYSMRKNNILSKPKDFNAADLYSIIGFYYMYNLLKYSCSHRRISTGVGTVEAVALKMQIMIGMKCVVFVFIKNAQAKNTYFQETELLRE